MTDLALYREAWKLTYIVYPAKDADYVYHAHCLELDVVSQASSTYIALHEAIRMAVTTLKIDREQGDDPYRRRAPDRFWPPAREAEEA